MLQHVKSERTLFFPLGLKGVGTGEVESLRSYVERLALAHRLNPTTLLGLLIERSPMCDDPREREAYHLTQYWQLHGASDIGRRLVERLSVATSIDLSSSTLARFGELFSPVGLSNRRGVARYCPLCVVRPSGEELPYGRLLWMVGSCTACPIHRVRLRDTAVCGAAASNRLERHRRPSLEGVCGLCGSIGFQCLAESQPDFATGIEVWKAEQIRKLLSLSPSDVSALSQERFRAGLQVVVDLRFQGQSVKPSLDSGLARSVVWSWIAGKVKPTLGGLLKFCAHAECDLVAMLQGRYQRCARALVDAPEQPQRRAYRRNQLTDDEIRNRILSAALMDQPLSGAQLATSLGVDTKALRTRFKDEYGALMSANKRYKDAASERRYVDYERRLSDAAASLMAQGRAVHRKSLQLEAGITSYRTSGNAQRALEMVMQRFGCCLPPG